MEEKYDFSNDDMTEEDKQAEELFKSTEVEEDVNSSAEEKTDDVFSEKTSSVKKFDWENADDDNGIKLAERKELDGQIVPITGGEILIPTNPKYAVPTRDKKHYFVPSRFVVFFGHEGQGEYYSGVKNFLDDDGKIQPKPSVLAEGKSQTSMIMQKYAKLKNVHVKSVSLPMLLKAINSGKLYAEMETKEVKNPETDASVKKNFIKRFIEQEQPHE